MDAAEIQNRTNAIVAPMLVKGLRAPEVSVRFQANSPPQAALTWVKAGQPSEWDREYEFINAENLGDLFDRVGAFIAAMPDAAERRHREFMDALGAVIDLGRENGIDVEYVNPLVASMKKLSENIITHQPEKSA